MHAAYACVCMCMYVCRFIHCMYVDACEYMCRTKRAWAKSSSLHRYMYLHMYVCRHDGLTPHRHVFMLVCVYAHLHVCVASMCMQCLCDCYCLCVYLGVYVLHIPVYMYICTCVCYLHMTTPPSLLIFVSFFMYLVLSLCMFRSLSRLIEIQTVGDKWRSIQYCARKSYIGHTHTHTHRYIHTHIHTHRYTHNTYT